MITKFGKRFLTTYLAGNAEFGNKTLALGIANSSDYAEADTNSRLGFEFYKLPVDFGSVDIQPSNGGYSYTVVYKATIPQDIIGTIKEVGLYSSGRKSTNNFDSKFLSTFENNLDWFYPDSTNGVYVTSSDSRIGSGMMRLDFLNSSTTTNELITKTSTIDISGYSANDTLTLAYNRLDTNLSKVRIKFYSSDTDYYYGDITPSSGTGNKIQSVTMAYVFSHYSGQPNASSISKIGIEVTRSSTSSSCSIYLDGLRINDEDTFDATYGMISRSVLSSPITKIAGRQIDIEYRLDLGWS
jgi:hypothetical protein